jgi:chromatin segregation and condensation protein Rec8/ScpA/Scc1 (kleisin family)
MNTVKDSWDDDDDDDTDCVVINLAELQKLENRKKEEEADHELTEDLFVMSKQPKPAVVIKPQAKHLTPKPKTRELVSKKDENERKIKQKVAVKKQVAASKQKHATVFGDTELDELQDEYCDYEDRY